MRSIRHFENLHILLWLLKDISWLLEWRIFGTFMIVPTILVAIYLTVRSYAKNLFWINLAICFWISANGYWMLCEFFERVELKNYAAFPFIAGLLSVSLFFYRELRNPLPAEKDEL